MAAVLVAAMMLAGCANDDNVSSVATQEAATEEGAADTSSDGSAETQAPVPNTAESATPTEEASPTSDAAASPGDGERVSDRAIDCVPGTWAADMDQFVKTFPTPGKPTYVAGSYTFTFNEDLTYQAVGDDVTFRITDTDGFVDVHNSWQEGGMWGGENENVTFDEVLAILGLPGTFTANDLALNFAVEETDLLAVAGDTFTSGENYGMVNGTIRTPPLSDEGAAIIAPGVVDCAAGRMTLLLTDPARKSAFDLTKQ